MAFDTSVSGILSASADLGIIGNNIANASTTGFKQSRGEFTDIYASSLLGTASTAIGQGVKLNSVTQDFSQGNIEFTNSSLDLAINGNGFFRLSNDGVATYTRAGSFQVDREGYLVNASNMKLQGFPIDEGGNITGELTNIRLSTQLIDPKATSQVEITANLDSRADAPNVGLRGPAILEEVDDGNGGTITQQATDAEGNPLFYDFTPFGDNASSPSPEMFNSSTSLTVYDGFGNPHVLSLYFRKEDGALDADGNAVNGEVWSVTALIDGVEQPNAQLPGDINYLVFGSNGKLDTTDAGLYGGAAKLTIPDWTPLDSAGAANGAANETFTIDLSTFTQFGADFAVGSINQDGYATGQLRGVEIDSSGILYTRYTNGQSRSQSQIAMASFTNPNGLQPVGDTNFVETFSAGSPTITTPGLSGTGALQSGALEASNVEITSQLVRMIIAQRNFQANAQMIQTEDAVTQTVINLR
jgi:flagellar hook protein FlgE